MLNRSTQGETSPTGRPNPGRIRRHLIEIARREEDRPSRTPRKRHDAMRLTLRLQVIEAFARETGKTPADPIVRKIKLKPEIEILATVDRQAREMRWSYANGSLVRRL